MGIFDWKYNASDLADWFDEQEDKHWNEHDEWIIDAYHLGDAQPVFVFASWLGDRIDSLPQRMSSSLTGGIVDVLRLGSDLDLSSGWGITKGVFLNLTRVATIAGPVSELLGISGRYAGVLATSGVNKIEGAAKPCAYVSINNLLSYLHGKTVRLFATLEDITEVAGTNTGMWTRELLESAKVQSAFKRFGIAIEELGGMSSIEDVLNAAKATGKPITFTIAWKRAGELEMHVLTAVKDEAGLVRILDYVQKGGEGVFRGFTSLAEMAKARPAWGDLSQAVLLKQAKVFAFSSRYLRLLKFGDNTFSFGVPVAMGLRWLRGATTEEKVFNMARSVWRFVKFRNRSSAPPPQAPSVPPEIPASIASVPTTPDNSGKHLGVSPLSAEARSAPRIDWLTGVQYRLKYLGYYKGPVNGVNDQTTKRAVLDFQKDWLSDRKQWDSIPGPITQAALYAAIGW